MAGIFKSIKAADIRVTPFRTYKLWAETFTSPTALSGSIYTVYQGKFNPISDHPGFGNVFDEGNPHYTMTEPTTSNGQYQRVVHSSIYHLYYRDFYTNNKASFGSGNINTQTRVLGNNVYAISIPQSKFGESILPESVKIQVSYNIEDRSGPGRPGVHGTWTVKDDGLGNMFITPEDITKSDSYLSIFGELLGSSYSSSVTTPLAGQWPFDNLYRYVGTTLTGFTSSFNKGLFSMESHYNNIQVLTTASSYYTPVSTYPYDTQLMGPVMHFGGNSYLNISSNEQTYRYNKKYNFENCDFSVSFIIRPDQLPSTGQKYIILEKRGPINDLKVDQQGNIHSQITPTKTPYRLYVNDGGFVTFEKTDGITIETLTSVLSLQVQDCNHVTLTKSSTSNTYTLYVSTVLPTNNTQLDIQTLVSNLSDKDCSNLSDIYIGNNYTNGNQGFKGVLHNIKFFKGALSKAEHYILFHTLGFGNAFIGNVFYNNGIVTLSSYLNTAIYNEPSPTNAKPIFIESRGTHTIWENEISCLVNPGEFGMSNNPTLQQVDSKTGENIYIPFVTGSTFKPYVTTIGLYDDIGNLLIAGKLSQPIQLPNNTDTTFILRYDK